MPLIECNAYRSFWNAVYTKGFKVSPHRDVSACIDQFNRNTHAVGLQIAIAFSDKPLPVQYLAAIASFAVIRSPDEQVSKCNSPEQTH